MSLFGLKVAASSLLELIYPAVCAGCGAEMHGNDPLICTQCIHSMSILSAPVCLRCGAPLLQPQETLLQTNRRESIRCTFCPEGKHYFNQIRSVYSYKDERVKNIIHALKFQYHTKLAKPLSKLLYRGFERFYIERKLDAIIPIPLHISRFRDREFNQATLLSEEIQAKTMFPIREDLLYRTRKTPPQSKLPTMKRRINLDDAFACHDESSVYGLRILIIDDVMTTGATINAASKVLRKAGAKAIYALTLAQTIDLPENRFSKNISK